MPFRSGSWCAAARRSCKRDQLHLSAIRYDLIHMRKPTFDPGLTQQFTAPLRRVINKDGSFNVHRRGASWRDFHPYLHLINLSWPSFLWRCLPATWWPICCSPRPTMPLGPGQLQGADAPTAWGRFLNTFFFSSHTLSTVGYGNITPKGTARTWWRRSKPCWASWVSLWPRVCCSAASHAPRPDRLQREHGGGSVPGGHPASNSA